MKQTIYHIYKVLRDNDGNIVHKTPMSATTSRKMVSALLERLSGHGEYIVVEE